MAECIQHSGVPEVNGSFKQGDLVGAVLWGAGGSKSKTAIERREVKWRRQKPAQGVKVSPLSNELYRLRN